eukprot:7382800-Prymnesium_polylepis.1
MLASPDPPLDPMARLFSPALLEPWQVLPCVQVARALSCWPSPKTESQFALIADARVACEQGLLEILDEPADPDPDDDAAAKRYTHPSLPDPLQMDLCMIQGLRNLLRAAKEDPGEGGCSIA